MLLPLLSAALTNLVTAWAASEGFFVLELRAVEGSGATPRQHWQMGEALYDCSSLALEGTHEPPSDVSIARILEHEPLMPSLPQPP